METFASFELAEKSLLDQMIWVRRGAKKYEKTTRSYKQFYRCKLVKARSKVQCSSGCYIILNANNTNAEVYSTSCPHDHSGKVLSVSIEARIEIDKMFKVISRIKPKTILSNLEIINFKYVKRPRFSNVHQLFLLSSV